MQMSENLWLGGEVSEGDADVGDEVLGGELDLEAALASGDIDGIPEFAGLVDKSGERFLHADRAAATANIARQGQQFLHWNEAARLIAARTSGFF